MAAPLKHGALLNVVQKLYPAFTSKGICHGLAVASIQAIMADELPTFLHRLYALGEVLEKKSPEDFAKDILAIETDRVELIKAYRKELLAQLDPQNPNMGDHDFYRLLQENKDHPAVLDYHTKRNAVEDKLTEEQRNFSDVHAFLDTLTLYYDPAKFPEFFEEKAIPSRQDITDPTLLLGLPDILLEVIPFDDKKEEPEKKNFYLNRKPLVKHVASTIGAYNLAELTEYFKQLHPPDPGFDPPVALLIQCGDHTISVSYNQQGYWQLIDANQLPIIGSMTDKDIAQEVLWALSKNDVTVFVADLFCHKSQADNVNAWLSEVKKSDEWKKLHAVKKETRTDSTGHSLLFVAAAEGKIDVVRALLENKVDVDQAEHSGMTPLCIAVQNGYLEIIKVLLKNKANINYLEKHETPLLIAAKEGNIELITYLLNNGADVNLANSSGTRPIDTAIFNGQIEVVKILLRNGAKVDGVFDREETPLRLAVMKKNLAIIKVLLDHGADPNQKNKSGNTPLISACIDGSIEIVKVFLNHKTNVLEEAENGLRTPLCVAAQHGHQEIVSLLFERQANVSKADGRGYSPIDYAAANGHVQILKMLIEHRDQNNQPSIDINKPDIDGFTPLMAAARGGKLQIINELLELKDPMVDTDVASPKGITAFYMAAQEGYTPIIKALLPRLSPQVLDLPIQASSKILLTHAVSTSREQEVKNLFLEKGVTEDGIIDGFTPLHAAIFFGRTDIVKILIEAGCGINKTTQQGISAIDFARAMNQQDIIKELEQAQALQDFHKLPIDAETKVQALQLLDSRSLDIEVKTAALNGIIDESEDKNDALKVVTHIIGALDNLKKLESPHLNSVENQAMIARAGKDAASIAKLLTQHPTKEDALKNKPSESIYSFGGIYRTLKKTSVNLPFFSPKKTVEKKQTPQAMPPIEKPKSGH